MIALARKAIQKISAFIAGCVVFATIWLTMNPYTLILDTFAERTVVAALGTIIAVLVVDAGIGYFASILPGNASVKKPKIRQEEGTAYLCPNCGQTYAKPVNIMDPKTKEFLYSVCPKCAKPLIPQYIQPAQPLPQPPPPPAAVPPPPPVDPTQAARALGIEKVPAAAPEAPKAKPRLELRPDGTIVVYPGE